MVPQHRENLMRHMEKDRVRQKLDKAVYLHALMKGVLIAHIGVCKNTQTLHGPKHLVEKWSTGSYGDDSQTEDTTVERNVCDGASVTIINPEDFVFDTDNFEDWDSCFKACQKYLVYEDIESDANFANYEELFELVQTANKSNTQNSRLNKKKKNKIDQGGVDESGRLSVIEFHGDIRLEDGHLLRNWTIVIGGKSKVIRFEENPFFINPFQRWEFEPTEDGWGVSPLAYILGLVDASSILLSTGVEAAKQTINPAWLAPEKTMQQKKVFIKEGMIIDYKPNVNAPNVRPEPITFKYDAGFPFLQLFEQQSESVTGATRQMSGNVTTNDNAQTATEFKGLQVVGNLVLDRLVDLFNIDFKIPVIEKIALINAMANPEQKEVPIDNDKGVREFVQLEPKAYFGNYEYKIEDNKAELERKQNAQEKLQFIELLNRDPIVGPRLKKIELAKDFLHDMGYGQAGKYFMSDFELMQFQLKEIGIQQEIQIAGSQRLNRRMLQEGVMPNVPADQNGTPGAGNAAQPAEQAGVGVAESQGLPGATGMETV